METKTIKDFYWHYPMRINRKTIGVSHRRRLVHANPRLTSLLSIIGQEWVYDPNKLVSLLIHRNSPRFKKDIGEVKQANKCELAKYIRQQTNISVETGSIFDVQLKNIAASRRQLLNLLHILYLYSELKNNASFDMYPRTFIFAGKAGPSDSYAKTVVRLINETGYLINNDRRIGHKLKLVFLENYSVNLAELVLPATDLSEQFSTASAWTQ